VVSRVVLIGLLLAGLAACAVGPEKPAAVYESVPAQPDRTPAAVAPPPVDAGVRQASNSLLLEARSARADGTLDRAEAMLQRAQRIDPANAAVYLELAELYSQRGQYGESRSVAERGLLYCSGRDCDSLRELASAR
jgi:Flp pilus assembly protein TadD